MKNIYQIFTAITLFFVVTSCKKNSLDEVPYSFISDDALYNTNAGCEAALNGCYNAMADYGGFGAGYPTIMSIAGGGFYTTQGPASDMNALAFGANTLWLTNNSPWDAFYKAIAVANDIILKVPQGNAVDSIKRKTIGEAYLLRAINYFNLVRMFGGVPLHTEPPTANSVHKARATVQQSFDLIIADLEKAKTMMGAVAVKGRPTKYAAWALLGKVYIQMAGNDNTSPNWAKAKTELLEVIARGGYSLVSNSELLISPTNENSSESIIEIQYTNNASGPNGQHCNFYTPSQTSFTPLAQNGPFGRNRVNKDIYDRHKTQYPTDPRIDAYYIDSSVRLLNGTTQTIYPLINNAQRGWPYLKHYVDPTYTATYSNRNFVYLRYADILLSLAEVENELTGPANAYNYVNLVLRRARDRFGNGTSIATTPADWSGMTQDQFRDRIMRERRYELVGEFHIWYDVRRRGQTEFFNFLTEHNNHPTFSVGNDKTYPLNARYLLLPIPEKEINLNFLIDPSNQNPGY
jgi:starch-binding outer membrane protein, SusD/RagB family